MASPSLLLSFNSRSTSLKTCAVRETLKRKSVPDCYPATKSGQIWALWAKHLKSCSVLTRLKSFFDNINKVTTKQGSNFRFGLNFHELQEVAVLRPKSVNNLRRHLKKFLQHFLFTIWWKTGEKVIKDLSQNFFDRSKKCRKLSSFLRNWCIFGCKISFLPPAKYIEEGGLVMNNGLGFWHCKRTLKTRKKLKMERASVAYKKSAP